MQKYLREALRYKKYRLGTHNPNVMSEANIPPDHMEAKMWVQHIVQLNCQSAPLKIGHAAESSGGCGTQQEKKGFHRKAGEKRDSSKAPAE